MRYSPRATSAGSAPPPGGTARPSAARPSGAGDPVVVALAVAADIAAAGIETLVVDAEDGDIRLGLARQLADAMGASYAALPGLAADALARAVLTMVAADGQGA